MHWLLGALALLIAAWALRRLLRMNSSAEDGAATAQLRLEREAVYAPIGLELETQTTILSVLLNDAFNERDAGRLDNAWRLVKLAGSTWEQVAEVIAALLGVLQKNVTYARVPVPYRGMVTERFTSQTMIDYLRMHELLIQLVFRSKMRFQLQVDMLRRAADTLSTEFHRLCRYGAQTEDRSPEVWERLDMYCHDFDLVTKEALLALRACLISLPDYALKDFSAALEPILQRGVRTASITRAE